MKDQDIKMRIEELAVLFDGIPDHVLIRFANRNKPLCVVYERQVILRTLATGKNTGRENLKIFLSNSVPEALHRKPEWSWESKLKERYEKHISCDGLCVFSPKLPCDHPEHDEDYVKNAQEVAKRDRELLTQMQVTDDALIRSKVLKQDEDFSTAASDSENAKAEAAFRDGLVKLKMAELERYVKEQMTELRKENQRYLNSLRNELLEGISEK